MDTVTAVSLVFLTVLAHCRLSYSQTGIERVPTPNGSVCSNVLTYICSTTGRGAAEINVAGSVLSIRHSQYVDGRETVRNSSDNVFTARNLLRSDSNDSCYDPVLDKQDYCYTTELVIPVTERTMCQNITCSTLGKSETTLFGAALVERVPMPPYNLQVNQSTNGVSIAWMPDTEDCPSARFEVSTTNCGSCSGTIDTTSNRITCDSLAMDQMCHVSVRSVSECGSYSEPVVMTVTDRCSVLQPCQNGATCHINMNSSTGYVCVCIDGFSGQNCSVEPIKTVSLAALSTASSRDSPTHIVVLRNGRIQTEHDYASIKSRDSPAPKGGFVIYNFPNGSGNGNPYVIPSQASDSPFHRPMASNGTLNGYLGSSVEKSDSSTKESDSESLYSNIKTKTNTL